MTVKIIKIKILLVKLITINSIDHEYSYKINNNKSLFTNEGFILHSSLNSEPASKLIPIQSLNISIRY